MLRDETGAELYPHKYSIYIKGARVSTHLGLKYTHYVFNKKILFLASRFKPTWPCTWPIKGSQPAEPSTLITQAAGTHLPVFIEDERFTWPLASRGGTKTFVVGSYRREEEWVGVGCMGQLNLWYQVVWSTLKEEWADDGLRENVQRQNKTTNFFLPAALVT
jgi:hypothetical protein